MGVYERITRAVSANVYGQIVNVLVQLLTIPLLISAWGIGKYGEWVILSAIPAYLIMSDFGIGQIACNKMIEKETVGDGKGSIKIYQSLLLFNLLGSLSISIVFIGIVHLFEIYKSLGVESIDSSVVTLIVFLQIIQVVLSLQSNAFLSAYKCLKRHAEGAFLFHSIKLFEWGLGISSVLIGQGVLGFILFMIVGRLIGTFFMYFKLLSHNNDYRINLANSSVGIIKKLIVPGVTFMSFPLGISIMLQGMTLIIGAVVGSAGAGVFNALRTLVRVVIQGVTIINQSFWPELTRAYSKGDYGFLTKLYNRSIVLAIVMAAFGGLGLALFGELFVMWWIDDDFLFDFEVFIYLLFGAVVSVLAQPAWVLLVALSKHFSLGLFYLFLSVLSLIIAKYLVGLYGVVGAAYSIIAFEVGILIISYIMAKNLMSSLK